MKSISFDCISHLNRGSCEQEGQGKIQLEHKTSKYN